MTISRITPNTKLRNQNLKKQTKLSVSLKNHTNLNVTTLDELFSNFGAPFETIYRNLSQDERGIAPSLKNRRKFNVSLATEEIGYHKTNGGLNDLDRDILSRIYHGSNSVIEWGVGESTLIAEFVNVPRYVGVDSSRDWLLKVASTSPWHYKLTWADIGPLAAWGNPKDESGKERWPRYSISPLASEKEPFDFYFVDGRFRVACVCASFLHASYHHKPSHSFRVGLHDFNLRHMRGIEFYGVVLSIADIVEGFDPTKQSSKGNPSSKIVVLQRKASVSDSDLLRIWNNYATIQM